MGRLLQNLFVGFCLLFVVGYVFGQTPPAPSGATCDPFVGQTTSLPDKSLPAAGYGYLGFRLLPEPFHYRYFYCLQNNKWVGFYEVFRWADVGAFNLPAGTTLDHFARQQLDSYNTIPGREDRLTFLNNFLTAYQRSWGSCGAQLKATPPGPHADVCRIANDVTLSEKPVDPVVTPPPVVAWVVASTGLCSTADKVNGACAFREVYAWDGSARGNVIPGAKARIGDPCVTTIGLAPYYGFDATTIGRVTACVLLKK